MKTQAVAFRPRSPVDARGERSLTSAIDRQPHFISRLQAGNLPRQIGKRSDSPTIDLKNQIARLQTGERGRTRERDDARGVVAPGGKQLAFLYRRARRRQRRVGYATAATTAGSVFYALARLLGQSRGGRGARLLRVHGPDGVCRNYLYNSAFLINRAPSPIQ